jgi:hypothetical protein
MTPVRRTASAHDEAGAQRASARGGGKEVVDSDSDGGHRRGRGPRGARETGRPLGKTVPGAPADSRTAEFLQQVVVGLRRADHPTLSLSIYILLEH